MTKDEKLAVLDKCMTVSTRDDGTDFNHFTDEAPEELKDLYLEYYEVRDQDYEIFARACDIVGDVYAYKPDSTDEEATDAIYEEASDSASVYTADRLEIINIWNEEEISEMVRSEGHDSIAQACASWYDRQVEQAAIIIKDWVNAEA